MRSCFSLPLISRALCFAVGTAAAGLGSVTSSAQSISTFIGTTNDNWTISTNWSPAAIPSGTGSWALINSQTNTLLRIFYPSTAIPTAPALDVGAISFLPTLANASDAFGVQNNSSGTAGTLRFYGIDTTVDGPEKRYILINSSTLANVSFTQANAGQDFELYTSGAVHVADGTQLTLTPTIKDGTGSQSITKTGAGILTFSGATSAASTYAGGFVLEGGIVQWTTSGSSAGNPFGIGPITLRSGTLRSSSSTGRSIFSSVILDGTVTLGSPEGGFTGDITINSVGGARTTTMASDSIVTVVAGGSTAWNQSVSGTGSLTKAGAGLLRFTPLSTLTHTGSTVVAEGTLVMVGNLDSVSPVLVLAGAMLSGTGTIAGPTSILAGGTFSPGATSEAVGLFTIGSGGLALAGETVLDLTGTSRGTAYDGVNFTAGGGLTYGGSMLLRFSDVLPDGTYDLFSDFASQTGSFSSINLTGSYSGALTEQSPGVWSGSFGSQTITFTNSTGSLSIVPEPSAVLLLGLGAGIVAVRCHRRARRRSTVQD
jgi:autotransporter-associated beta strand protein